MISLPVVEPSQAGAARRRCLQAARSIGLDDAACDRLAIVVTELATNLLRHARQGELLFGGMQAASPAFMVIAADDGPGIANVHLALEDGFSTADDAQGIGGGLGAIRRLSDAFDIHSDEQGTIVTACFGTCPGGSVDNGSGAAGLVVAKPGHETGGDNYAIRPETDATIAMLVDVLGHGTAAATEAKKAIKAFDAMPDASLQHLKEGVEQALKGGRGAAATLVRVPHGPGTVTATGLGNVRGEIVAADGTRKGILVPPGIMGSTTKRPFVSEHDWPAGATLILATDGLRSGHRHPLPPTLFSRAPVTIAAALYKRQRRGSDDSGVVVVRGAT